MTADATRNRRLAVLEAAVAASIAVCIAFASTAYDRYTVAYWSEEFADHDMFVTQRDTVMDATPGESWRFQVVRFQSDLSLGLVFLAFGVVVLNLIRMGREPGTWRAPGAVAAVAATAMMLLCTLEEAVRARTSPSYYDGRGLWEKPSDPFPNAWPLIEQQIATAVLAAWFILVLTRSYAPRPSATDRLGRVVGWLWIGMIAYRLTAQLLLPSNNWRY